MFSYNKFLEFPVKVSKPNPRLANVVITQYGGPNGELGASLRYLSQRYTMSKMKKERLFLIVLFCGLLWITSVCKRIGTLRLSII